MKYNKADKEVKVKKVEFTWPITYNRLNQFKPWRYNFISRRPYKLGYMSPSARAYSNLTSSTLYSNTKSYIRVVHYLEKHRQGTVREEYRIGVYMLMCFTLSLAIYIYVTYYLSLVSISSRINFFYVTLILLYISLYKKSFKAIDVSFFKGYSCLLFKAKKELKRMFFTK